ncbi:hypothetical protein KAF25_003025 [Fusarium avenaceum]|uniref:Ribosomal protein S21 n=1 Tax=Fusarium avenaceum TaxID=40199 RepID=A0A9P7KSN6_9HYPO|nr:hypothetical protein KAF25_003025 [Fusarium avenaceum]
MCSSDADIPRASFRTGSAMLFRVATPSVCLAKRSFTTSLAFRTGPKIGTDEEAPPAVAPQARSSPYVFDPAQQSRPSPLADATPADTNPVDPNQPRSNPLIGSVPPPPPAGITSTESKPSGHNYDATKPFTLDIASIIASRASTFSDTASDPVTRPQIRAKPVTGRTVFVKDRITKTSGPTPMVALRVLNRMVRDDQVKNKFHSQKFHERKGLKKKRLRSQRWRSRFKHGFKATVSRVIELKKQGW